MKKRRFGFFILRNTSHLITNISYDHASTTYLPSFFTSFSTFIASSSLFSYTISIAFSRLSSIASGTLPAGPQ